LKYSDPDTVPVQFTGVKLEKGVKLPYSNLPFS